MKYLLGILLSYLLGSIPTAYIFGKLYKGIDIRQHGSGNVGATNVFRVLGKTPGIAVLLLDILKGVIAVSLAADIVGMTKILERIVIAVFAVIGHNWTVFLRFKGGKGVATSLGVLIGLTIKIAAIRWVLFWTVFMWVAIFLATGFVSAASILAAVTLPIAMVLTDQSFELVLMGVLFCLFVVFRHKANIKRLFAGQEHRVQLFSKKR
ncbi:MAG TPA: glycerol-3-phosphate 1-O-acyltransferase PlsY [Candidatus Omnitrophota bacterium]|nr:glycerol-3-phosphate 1-O-acyltransferase PlsY [Candidatus Omnitrophota bacterium]